MTITELCKVIDLQPQIAEQVIEFSNNFDFTKVNMYLADFKIYENMQEATNKIQSILGEDKNNIKILSCMLKGAVDSYVFYKQKGISDTIYFDTMKCFTRFIDECYKSTGVYMFDREWWTARQVGCHLFRIGALEYEIKHLDTGVVIGIHIPSDVDFSRQAVDKSFNEAKRFFDKCFTEYADCEYRCHSWLLEPKLKNMLSENSNILDFQRRFKIIDNGEESTDFLEWVFNTKNNNYKSLPEKTSLQRNLKKYLLSGGKITTPYGVLIKNCKK